MTCLEIFTIFVYLFYFLTIIMLFEMIHLHVKKETQNNSIV